MEGWLHIEATDTDESSGTKLAKNVFSLSFSSGFVFSPPLFSLFPRFACTLSFVPGILPSRSERSLCLLWAKSSFRCRLAQSRHRGARGGQQELAARLAPQQCCSRLGLATTTLQFHPRSTICSCFKYIVLRCRSVSKSGSFGRSVGRLGPLGPGRAGPLKILAGQARPKTNGVDRAGPVAGWAGVFCDGGLTLKKAFAGFLYSVSSGKCATTWWSREVSGVNFKRICC